MASAETTQNPTVPAQEAGSSAGLCANCVSGYAIPGTPRGEAVTIGPYYTYVARPSSGAKSDKAVVYFLDALGLQLQNNKIIPDRIADALGVDVYVPDVSGASDFPDWSETCAGCESFGAYSDPNKPMTVLFR